MTHRRVARAVSCAFLCVSLAGLAACRREAPVDVAAAPATPADTSAPAAPVATGPAALIGKVLPPYPEGQQEVQGVCIPDPAVPQSFCGYGLAMLGTPVADGPPRIAVLIVSRNIQPDADLPRWRVSDAIAPPEIADGEELQLAACGLDGKDDAGIVAVVRHDDDRERSSDIRWARRFDVATGKLAEIDPARVACVNTAIGI